MTVVTNVWSSFSFLERNEESVTRLLCADFPVSVLNSIGPLRKLRSWNTETVIRSFLLSSVGEFETT